MLFIRNKRDTRDITLLNKLLATDESLEYIDSQWWYDGRCYDTLKQLTDYMMMPLSTTRYTLESYACIHRGNT